MTDETAFAHTLAGHALDETIRPTPRPESHSELESALPGAHFDGTDLERRLRLGHTIGEGGMGLVKNAVQVSLERDVAVKTLREPSESQVFAFLREAWVTAHLEHPNIVPVYDLGTDPAGRPHLVMRQIDGRSWAEQLEEDTPEAGVRVLLRVCDAIEFAHDRGILHRDIKPANVMVGRFGEVYVLDWGLAVGLRPEHAGRVPSPDQAARMAGTPGYMAPEMIDGRPPDERTDVYLLGASLFHVIAGAPPHRAPDPEQVIASIRASAPTFPPDTSEELAQICRRSMAAQPDDRYAGVAQLSRALRDWLDHRSSEDLALEAQRGLESLRGLIDSANERDAIYQAFAACRFGFEHALKVWPANPIAAQGLAAATELVADYEVRQGDSRSARRLVATLAAPPAELVTRLVALEAAEAQERRTVAQLEAERLEMDPARFSRVRKLSVILLAAAVVVGPAVEWLAWSQGLVGSHTDSLRRMVGLVAVLGASGFLMRKELLRTRYNRIFTVTTGAMAVACLSLTVAAPSLGLSFLSLQSAYLLPAAAVAAVASLVLGPALRVPAVVALVGFLVSAFVPEWVYACILTTMTTLVASLSTLGAAEPDESPTP